PGAQNPQQRVAAAGARQRVATQDHALGHLLVATSAAGGAVATAMEGAGPADRRSAGQPSGFPGGVTTQAGEALGGEGAAFGDSASAAARDAGGCSYGGHRGSRGQRRQRHGAGGEHDADAEGLQAQPGAGRPRSGGIQSHPAGSAVDDSQGRHSSQHGAEGGASGIGGRHRPARARVAATGDAARFPLRAPSAAAIGRLVAAAAPRSAGDTDFFQGTTHAQVSRICSDADWSSLS
ncbi:unnamed protein product, partial [Effrenium voratum]